MEEDFRAVVKKRTHLEANIEDLQAGNKKDKEEEESFTNKRMKIQEVGEGLLAMNHELLETSKFIIRNFLPQIQVFYKNSYNGARATLTKIQNWCNQISVIEQAVATGKVLDRFRIRITGGPALTAQKSDSLAMEQMNSQIQCFKCKWLK